MRQLRMNQNTGSKISGACLKLTDVVNYSQATTKAGEIVKTSVGKPCEGKLRKLSFRNEYSPRHDGRKTGKVLIPDVRGGGGRS